MRSIADPPLRSAFARFDPAFGQRFLLTVDTAGEETPGGPLTGERARLDHLPRLATFQRFCEGEGVVPVYLVDWPVALSGAASEILREPAAAGMAEIGIRFRPSVTPPFGEQVTADSTFAGNLPRAPEQAKIANLRDEIERRFEVAPVINRADCSGAGPSSPAVLIESKVAVDSSVRAKYDYSPQGGCDFRRHPLAPYWLDDERRLLELPPTTVFWGLLRRQGDWLYPAMGRMPRLCRALAQTGLLDRIPLRPEGVSVDQAIRGIDMALDDGLPLLVLSFDCSALQPGRTPYVHDENDLEDLYDWWRRVFAYLELRAVPPTTVTEVMRAVLR